MLCENDFPFIVPLSLPPPSSLHHASQYEKSDQHMKLLDTYPFLSGSFAGSLMFNDATFLCLLSLNATKQIAEHEKRT